MENLILKFKIPAEEPRFECPTCFKTFTTGKGLGGHKRIHMEKKRSHEAMDAQDGEKTLFCCPVCPQGYTSEKALHGHMRKHPNRGWRGMRPPPVAEGSQPPNPGQQDGGKSVIVENSSMLVNNNQAPFMKSQNYFPCEICGKCFKTYQGLGGHKSHHEEDKSAPPPHMEQSEGFAGVSGCGHGQLPVAGDEGDKLGNGDQPAAPRVVFDFDLNELPNPNGDGEY